MYNLALSRIYLSRFVDEWSRLPISHLFLQAPDEEERLQILHELLMDFPLALDVKIESVATQTAALVAADLVDLVVRVQTAASNRIVDAR